MAGTWEFSPQRGGSKRVEDGVWFTFTGNTTYAPYLGQGPVWAWVVQWPDHRRTVLDPHTFNLHSCADVETYIGKKWPLPGQESLL